ncbi:MAG: CPBP family intramembrane metalloprotease [Clostridiales bacterium]|nr:CPBP family intramembrane metalloprotease [Clostridiales bacterium]
MTFKENALKKFKAFSLAAFGLLFFLFIEYTLILVFIFFNIDREIYRGVFNFLVTVLTAAGMLLLAKLDSSFSKKPLIKIKKLGADQVVALIVIAFGMLGFVTTYIIVADKISAYIDSLRQSVEEYREAVDRYSDVSQDIVPVWDSIIYVFTLCFIVPVAEELVFRGIVFGQLRKGFGPWVSVLISAVVFGLMHGSDIHIGYALVCGLIIAACYYLTDSLIASIILHMIFNIFGSGVASFMSIEYFGISEEIRNSFMQVVNIASCMLMPVAVLLMAYLVSAKRKKDKALAESASSSDNMPEGSPVSGEDIKLSAGDGIEAQQ